MSKSINASTAYLLCLLIGPGLLAYPNPGSAGALYKWVDDRGQVRYSDRLPPSQVRKKHQQLNPQGVLLSTTDEAKSEEELAAEAEAKRKQDEKLAEEARLKAVQYKKDQVLLLTFSNEEELGLAREDRLEVLDSVIRLITKSLTSTQVKLDTLESNAEENYTSQGNEVPGGLAQKIEHFSRKIENRLSQLLLKQSEKDKINQQFDLDLARYRLLKSSTN